MAYSAQAQDFDGTLKKEGEDIMQWHHTTRDTTAPLIIDDGVNYIE